MEKPGWGIEKSRIDVGIVVWCQCIASMQVDDWCDLVVSNCQVEMLHHQKDLTAGAKKKRGIDHSHTQSDIYRGKKMYTIGSLKQARVLP